MRKHVKMLLLPLAILALWYFSSRFGWVNSYIVSSPDKVLQAFLSLVQSGKLWVHIYASLFRVFAGFLAALLASTLVTLIFYFFPKLRSYCQGTLDILRHIPPLAVLSLLVLWFGIGEAPKVWIVFMASFFPLLLNMEAGVLQCPPKLLEVGKIGGFSQKQLFFRIVLPSAMPSVVTGMNVGLSYAWRSLIGAELVAASSGLGYMILDARELSRPDIIIVGILCLGLVGALIDRGFAALTQRLPFLRQA